MFSRTEELRDAVDKDNKPYKYPVTVCRWKGVGLAVFSGDDQNARVDAYLKTHAYLAEWSSQWREGNNVNWDDSMFVAYTGE